MEIFSNSDTDISALEIRQTLFKTEATDYRNTRKTEAFRTIEKTFVLDNIFADLYDTGLFRITKKGEQVSCLGMTHCQELFLDGNLEKFLKTFDSIAGSLTPNSSQRGCLTLEYNESESGETVRDILKDTDLSEFSKIGSIVSLLYFCPALPSKETLEIAKKQIENANDETTPVEKLSFFLTPGFSILKKDEARMNSSMSKLDPYDFMQYISHAVFFAQPESDETYAGYFERNSENFFKPIVDHPEYKALDSIALSAARYKESILYKGWSHGENGLMSDLTSTQAARFVTLSGGMSEVSAILLKQRIKAGDQLATEDPEWQKKIRYSDRHMKLLNFGRVLTTSEIYKIFGESSNTVDMFSNVRHLGDFSTAILANYYLRSGFEKFAELVRIIESDSAYSGFWNEIKGPFKLKDSSNRVVTFETFMNALEPEYADYPLEWALSMVTAEKTNELTPFEVVSQDKAAILDQMSLF